MYSAKKISIVAFICASFVGTLNASEALYSEIVKPVYDSAEGTKVIGKLLPTNKFKILSKEADRIKVELQGYENPAAKGVVYAVDGARVIAVAFSKTAKPDIKVLKKGTNGGWDMVSTSFYTTAGDTTNSVKPLFSKAEQLYSENCGICHALPEKSHFSANQWPAVFKSMISRTSIDKKDEWLVTQYLQKNSKDVKISK